MRDAKTEIAVLLPFMKEKERLVRALVNAYRELSAARRE